MRSSKYNNIFAKGSKSKWSEKVSVIIEGKHTVPWTYITCNINREKIVKNFYEKELQKVN